jgi:hypothetical protein
MKNDFDEHLQDALWNIGAFEPHFPDGANDDGVPLATPGNLRAAGNKLLEMADSLEAHNRAKAEATP